jgi:hypothetical protein
MVTGGFILRERANPLKKLGHARAHPVLGILWNERVFLG